MRWICITQNSFVQCFNSPQKPPAYARSIAIHYISQFWNQNHSVQCKYCVASPLMHNSIYLMQMSQKPDVLEIVYAIREQTVSAIFHIFKLTLCCMQKWNGLSCSMCETKNKKKKMAENESARDRERKIYDFQIFWWHKAVKLKCNGFELELEHTNHVNHDDNETNLVKYALNTKHRTRKQVTGICQKKRRKKIV